MTGFYGENDKYIHTFLCLHFIVITATKEFIDKKKNTLIQNKTFKMPNDIYNGGAASINFPGLSPHNKSPVSIKTLGSLRLLMSISLKGMSNAKNEYCINPFIIG